MPEQAVPSAHEGTIRLNVTGDQYRLIMGALAAKETSFDIFKDDSVAGFWRPKHALGVLSEKLAPQYIAQRNKFVEEQHDLLARLREVTLTATSEQLDLIVDALGSQSDSLKTRQDIIRKALNHTENPHAFADLARQRNDLDTLRETLAVRQAAAQKKATK